MKRLTAAVLALTIAFTVVLSGCSGKSGDNISSESSGSENAGSGNAGGNESVSPSDPGTGPSPTPRPVEGVNYIGVRVETESNGGHVAMELYMICNGDVITDCGTSDYTPGFRKEEFVGKTYKIGVRDFIGLIKADPNLNVVGLGAMIAGEEDYESYREGFDEGKNEHYRQIDVDGAARETEEKFIEICRMSEEKYKGEWKALVDGEGGGGAPDGGNPGGGAGPSAPAVKTLDELREQMKSGITRITLAGDITIDVSKDDIFGIAINCDKHAVTITGKLDGNAAYKKAGKNTLFELENASAVKLTGLSVSTKSFTKDNFAKKEVRIVVIHDTNKKNVSWPKDVPGKVNTMNMSPLSDFLSYNITSKGDFMDLTYHGPQSSYAERNKLETAMAKQILTKGKSSVKDDSGHKIDCQIWTKVTVNVGKAKIPKVEPQEIRIMKGGKLTVKGTIAVTGGRLNFTIYGSDCLDIRNLKLTKKHPSPDMVKIRFGTKKLSPNMKLLKAKATKGKIKVTKGTESVDITIW